MGDVDLALEELRWRRYFPKTDDPELLLQGFLNFATEAWFIKHPKLGKILFPITEEQVGAARQWIRDRYCIDLKARQIGYSTLMGAVATWETIGWPDRQEIMLSKGEHEAQQLLRKAKYGLKFLPKWMLSRFKILTNNTEKIAFDNESSIESLPSKEDPARGETVFRVWVDEWASLPNPEEAWASIEPITDVGGSFVGLSTAKGWGSFFHSMWVSAKLGENGFSWYFADWSAAKHRDQAWYDAQVRKFKNTPWILHQEYPRNDDEAWMKYVRGGLSAFQAS